MRADRPIPENEKLQAAVAAKEAQPSNFAVAAALTALLALALTAKGLPLLGVFALAILLSRVTTLRVRDQSFLRWLLRVLLITVVWIATPDTFNPGAEALGTPHARNLFGELCAAEMTLQFWRYRTYDPRRSNLVLLLVTGLTYSTASNVYEAAHIRYLTPLFLIFLGLMARDYRVRRPSAFTLQLDRETWARRRPPLFPTLLRAAALIGAIGIGLIGYRETVVNRAVLMELGNRVLSKSPWEVDMGGMSAQPELGSTFGLRGSAERVLRIENFAGDPHLDGVSYTDYDRSRWAPTASQMQWHNATEIMLRPARAQSLGQRASTETITRLGGANALLYIPLNAAAVDVGLDATDVARGTPDGGPFRARANPPFNYRVTVPLDEFYQGLLAQKLPPDQRARCLIVSPNLPPEIAKLANGIAGRMKHPVEKIAAVTGYLLSHHKYSLEYHAGQSGVDPVADFLLSNPPKAAHCVFFATSAAILLRCVGVPTRYVTGYYAHETEDKNIVVRQRDAHAWCEAWIDGTGWVTVDATPGDGKPDALAEKTPVEPWRRIYEWFQDKVQALTEDLANITPTQIGLGLVALATVSFGSWMLRLSILRRRTGAAIAPRGDIYSLSDPTLGELSRRFEAAWKRVAGVAPPTNQTYAEYLRLLPIAEDATPAATPRSASTAAIMPAALAAARQFARSYEAVRFGGPAALDADARAAMLKDLEELEQTEMKTRE